MNDLNARVQQSYHLLSEIDPKQGLNIADAPGKSEHIAFSHATQQQLTRLKGHLVTNSNAVTPHFSEDGGMAVLTSLELGQEHQSGEAARILTKLADVPPLAPSVTQFDADAIARITSKPVAQRSGLSA